MDKPFAAYRGPEPYVFICYAHADDAVVYPELEWLRDAGINIWYDEGISPGAVWRRELAESIRGASKLIYFKSKASLRSEHCNREIEFALDKGVEVIPLFLDKEALTPELDLALNRVQALHKETDSNYRRRLLDAVNHSMPAPAMTQARPRNKAVWPWVGLTMATLIFVVWWYQQSHEPEVPTDTRIQTVAEFPLTSVAVLPFDDLSPEGSQAWLANGMSDSLISSLGRIEELRIPGHTSTAKLKHQGDTIATIGEKLKVGSVVEGSIRRVGERLDITARWVRVADEKTLWSARYVERKFDDVFDVQNEVAVGIAEAIRAESGIKDSYDFMMESRYQPGDARAWENFRRAYDIFASFNRSRIPEAEELCREAIEIDSEYSGGYSCLSMAVLFTEPAHAIKMAKRALELNPFDGVAHWSLGRFLVLQWKFVEAETQLTQAVAARPREPNILNAYVALLRATGRHEELLKQTRKLAESEPFLPTNRASLAKTLVIVGEFEAALAEFDAAKAIGPIAGSNTFHIAIANRELGREAVAVDRMVEMARSLPEEDIREAYEQAGWSGLNLYLAENLGSRSCWPALLGYAGQKDRMYACLEKEFAAERGNLPEVVYQKFGFENYWEEPHFQDFLRRLKVRTGSSIAG